MEECGRTFTIKLLKSKYQCMECNMFQNYREKWLNISVANIRKVKNNNFLALNALDKKLKRYTQSTFLH
jgi:hypothetical protein